MQFKHVDDKPGLGFVIALGDGVRATEFLRLPDGVRWMDSTAQPWDKCAAHLADCWRQADVPGAVISAGEMDAGDVVFFYTHAIHGSPEPPALGEPERHTMFGVWGRDGKSEGAPFYRRDVCMQCAVEY